MGDRERCFALAAIALTFMFVAMPESARAATITVQSTVDDTNPGHCTLREAINSANASGGTTGTCTAGTGTDTIVFQSGLTGTISLGSMLPEIANTLTITGPTNAPGITIDGGGTVQLIQVNTFATLNLQFLTLIGASSTTIGGAILNHWILTVSDCTFSGNSAAGTGNTGGAIFNNGGTLTVTNSTFSGNSAGQGGAISNDGGLTVVNSTFSGNSAGQGGGAIFNNDGLTVVNSTFSSNSAPSGNGGGIENTVSYSSATLKGTILASSTGGNCASQRPAAFTDRGYNISDDTTCGFSKTGSADNGDGVDPMLASGLVNNGGPTETIALKSGSVAIAQIPTMPADYCTDASGNPLTTDQRGYGRPAPGQTDCCIGAYEFDAVPTPSATATATATPTVTATATATPTATATTTPTATATATSTATASATATATATATASATATATATTSGSATVTPLNGDRLHDANSNRNCHYDFHSDAYCNCDRDRNANCDRGAGDAQDHAEVAQVLEDHGRIVEQTENGQGVQSQGQEEASGDCGVDRDDFRHAGGVRSDQRLHAEPRGRLIVHDHGDVHAERGDEADRHADDHRQRYRQHADGAAVGNREGRQVGLRQWSARLATRRPRCDAAERNLESRAKNIAR